MTEIDAHRFDGIVSTAVADNGKAVLLLVRDSNGKTLPIEIELSKLAGIINAAFAISAKGAEVQRLEPSPPGDGAVPLVSLPCSDVHLVSRPAGALGMIFRVGVLDLSFQLDATGSKAFAQTLARMVR